MEVDESLLPHLVEAGERLRRVLLAWMLASLAAGLTPLPAGDPESLTLAAVRWMLERLSPQGMGLVQASVFAGFNVLVKGSLLLGALAAAPYAVLEFYRYAEPGLYSHERRALRLILAGALAAFYAGLALSLTLLLPALMDFYAWTARIAAGGAGPTAFSDVEALLSVAVQASLSVAVALQAPLAAAALYVSRLLDPAEVLGEWRLTLAASMLIGAVFSPDPSGLGMILLGLVVFASITGVGKIVEWRRGLRGVLERVDRVSEGGQH